MIKGYVGIPFLDGGRTREGCDCYGLVRLVMAQEAGLELPSYDLVSATDMLRVMRCMTKEKASRSWFAVLQPQPLDVVLMAHSRRPDIHIHVGIMVSPTQMLHSEEKAAAHLTGIAEPLVAARIRGFFRHAALAVRQEASHAA